MTALTYLRWAAVRFLRAGSDGQELLVMDWKVKVDYRDEAL